MDGQNPTESLAAEIKCDLHKKKKRKLMKSTNLKKRSNLNRIPKPSKSFKKVILYEYQMKSRLTWEYADMFGDINHWHESVKGENPVSESSESLLRLSAKENVEESPVTCSSSSNSIMKKVSALMHERCGTSHQISSPETLPKKTSDELFDGPIDGSSGRKMSGESTRNSSFGSSKVMNDVELREPRESLTTERFHKKTSVNNKKCKRPDSDYDCSESETNVKNLMQEPKKSQPDNTNCLLMDISSRCNLITQQEHIDTGDSSPPGTRSSNNLSHQSNRNNHQQIDSGESYKSTDCPKMFSKSRNLPVHQRIHTREKPFQCTECPKMFSKRNDLTKHLRIHSGEKPFKCTQCPKMFSQRGSLIRHQRIHSGEKPFKCTQCPRMFSQGSNLIIHQRIHAGEKSFKCTECPKKFLRGSSLSEHKRIHSGEKPYKCTECPKIFSTSSHLTKHKRSHSREKPTVP